MRSKHSACINLSLIDIFGCSVLKLIIIHVKFIYFRIICCVIYTKVYFKGTNKFYYSLRRNLMMDFYYMDLSPPCRAVWLTLSALGLSPNMKVVDLFKEEHNKPDFVAINPQHCVPTLVDGKLTIWERYVCLDSNTIAILNTPNCSTAQ